MSEKAVLTNRIHLKAKNAAHADAITECLTYRIEDKFRSSIGSRVPVYDITKTFIRYPRGYFSIPIGRMDLVPPEYEIEDNRILSPVHFPKPKLTLRPSQQHVYDHIADSATINAPVSWGKTFAALYIASKFAQKTLVITHTTILRDQWIKEVQKLYGFTPGVIGGGKLIDLEKPIVISNVQTLIKYIPQFEKLFGLVILDEMHHVPATSFSNISSLISGDEFDVWADNIVLATGGLAALYQDYTCPSILTGDGIALAYDAGAKVENLEFIQFHPTVFKTKTGKNFLISEALRGAGATLRNSKEELFANKYHPDAELATRDIVSRAICSEMKNTEADYVFIDARHLGEEFLKREFPTIYSFCLKHGFDLSKDLLPVRPAAHYSVGGIKTDVYGRTNVPGLFALGECASNGFHGANRLASNSLLECIVVPDLVAEVILAEEFNIANQKLENSLEQLERAKAKIENPDLAINDAEDNIEYCSNYFVAVDYNEIQFHKELVDSIRSVMSKNLGVERREKSIRSTVKFLEGLEESKEKTVALLIASSALQRKESRGVHFRIDAPRPLTAYERPTILSKESGTIKEARRIRINV